MTDLEALMLRAARASIADRGGPLHPTLSDRKLGDLTEAELREVIAWHERKPLGTASVPSSKV